MDQLPADVVRRIPATYRCWETLRMTCRWARETLCGDYHTMRGYSFYIDGDQTDYADYTRQSTGDLVAHGELQHIECLTDGRREFINLIDGTWYITYRGTRINLCWSRKEAPMVKIGKRKLPTREAKWFVAMIWYEFPQILHTCRVSVKMSPSVYVADHSLFLEK